MHSFLLLLAEAAKKAPSGGGGMKWDVLLLMILPMVAIFWLLLRPQKKREQERKAMLAELKKGDCVTTVGGMYGEIVRLNEREATLLVDKRKGVEIRVMRSALSGVVDDHKGAEGGEAAKERRL